MHISDISSKPLPTLARPHISSSMPIHGRGLVISGNHNFYIALFRKLSGAKSLSAKSVHGSALSSPSSNLHGITQELRGGSEASLF